MKKFIDKDFLLDSMPAKKLYDEYASNLPIIDYHCHLEAKEIFDDKQFRNITEAWLDSDHYKWRAMRSNGIDERFITGDASDYEKFLAWVQTVEKCIGNPLYHWTHLELQRYFDVYEPLTTKNAKTVWEHVNKLLATPAFGARGLINKSNVKVICTTNDPLERLEYHKFIAADKDFAVAVLPTFRPDMALDIKSDQFLAWINKLGAVVNGEISTFADLKAALKGRIKFFCAMGCKSSDQSLLEVPFVECDEVQAEAILQARLRGQTISDKQADAYKTALLTYLGQQYHAVGWAMQLHIGPLRNNNSRMFDKLGRDTGFDSINDSQIAQPLSKFLDCLAREQKLPRTVLYAINPKDNYVIGSMIGNFQGDGIPGKMQFGTAWWFNDNKQGMVDQMTALGNLGLLSQFIGMVTDSRSFLSYTRHEYFRRILCNLIGQWIENGEVPDDWHLIGKIVEDISFYNAQSYFNFTKE